MQNIPTLLLMISGQALGSEWAITSGGLSSDKKLAVGVFPQKAKSIDQVDDTVLLGDPTKDRKIGPLEEVCSSGGVWGTTATAAFGQLTARF